MGKTKKFIDPKVDKIYKFRVAHRSQKDPLAVEGKAPQNVLIEVKTEKEKKRDVLADEYQIYVDPDDEYDYLQHIRDVSANTNTLDGCEIEEVYTIKNKTADKPKLQLPSTAFASVFEEEVGHQNLDFAIHGPRPDWDPDIVAELDKEEDEIREDMDDDFISMLDSDKPIVDVDPQPEQYYDGENFQKFMYGFKAPKESDEESLNSNFSGSGNWEDDEEDLEQEGRDTLTDLPGKRIRFQSFNEEETKSQLTNYSLSSSVVSRSEHLRRLDETFEETFLREYNDDDIGALDGEDIQGVIDEDSEMFRELMPAPKPFDEVKEEKDRRNVLEWVKSRLEHTQEDDPEDFEKMLVVDDNAKKYNCASYRQTWVKSDNTPTIIHGISMRKSQLTVRAVANHNNETVTQQRPNDETQTILTTISMLSVRPKGETPEERLERKKAIKKLRQDRRIDKKQNKQYFKQEELKGVQTTMNKRRNKRVVVA